MTSRAEGSSPLRGQEQFSALDVPRVRPVPRWHLRARLSTAGQNRNFLGPSGRVRERAAAGHDTQTPTQAGADYNSRHAPQDQGPKRPSDATGSRMQTTTPGKLRKAEVYNSYWSFPAAGRRLTLAIPAAAMCSHNPWVWDLESSAAYV